MAEADGDWPDEEDEADDNEEEEDEDDDEDYDDDDFDEDEYDEDVESHGSSGVRCGVRGRRDTDRDKRAGKSRSKVSDRHGKPTTVKRKRGKRKAAQPSASVFSTNNTSSSGQYSSQSAGGSAGGATGGGAGATATGAFQRTAAVHSSLISRLTGHRSSGTRPKPRASSARTFRSAGKLATTNRIVSSCTLLTGPPGHPGSSVSAALVNSHSTSATTSSGVGTALPTISSSSSAGRAAVARGARHVPSYIGGSSSATGSGSGVAIGSSTHRYLPTDADRQKRKIAKAREKRATLILGLIMGSFIAGWIPFFGLYLLQGVCKHCQVQSGLTFGYWLGYCNSAINPIIYTVFNRDFRKAFRKILFR